MTSVAIVALLALGTVAMAGAAKTSITSASQTTPQPPLVQVAEQPATCSTSCYDQRKACLQGYLVPTTAGGQAVSPDGARICNEAYQQCMKGC